MTQVNAAAKTLRVDTTMVSVDANTRIRHGDTTMQLSQIVVGSRVHVRGVNSGTMVTAEEIKVQRNEDENENEVEVTGTVAGRTGACPALTFSIGSTMFMTNAATLFRDPCTAVVNSAVVEVKGMRQANGTVLVTRVKLEDEDEVEEENEVEATGTIAGRTGACPTLTFSIGSTTFRTDMATLFRDTTCAALVNGVRVEVKGTRQSTGPVLATRIHMED